MLLEIAEIDARPGSEDAFEAAMNEKGLGHLAACEGVISARLGRGVENPSKFIFHVVWTSIEAHEAARSLESFGKFRECFGDLTVGGAMNHFRMTEEVRGASA